MIGTQEVWPTGLYNATFATLIFAWTGGLCANHAGPEDSTGCQIEEGGSGSLLYFIQFKVGPRTPDQFLMRAL